MLDPNVIQEKYIPFTYTYTIIPAPLGIALYIQNPLGEFIIGILTGKAKRGERSILVLFSCKSSFPDKMREVAVKRELSTIDRKYQSIIS